MFSLSTTYSRLERVATENEKIAEVFPLISLSIRILALSHIVGLCYHLVAILEIELKNETKTWIHVFGLIDSPWIDRYIYIPQTNIEIIFSIVSIYIMTGNFGYALNTIGMILQDMGKKMKTYKAQRQMANRFFKKRKISEKLRERITLYLDFVQQKELEKNEQEEEIILDQLSSQLKLETMKEINQHYINKFQVPFQNFSQPILNEILAIIKEQNFSSDEYITKGLSSDLYVICKGKAQITIQNEKAKEINIFTMKKNEIFGKLQFFSGLGQNITVKSLESCMVLKIDRDLFMEIIKKSDRDYEIFCMIRDEFQQQNTSQYLPHFCELCKVEGHQIIYCPDCHFIGDKKKLIYDYINLDTQLRGIKDRILDRSHNAKDIKIETEEAIKEIFDLQNPDEQLLEKAYYYQDFYLKEEVIPKVQMDLYEGSQDTLNSILKMEETNKQTSLQQLISPKKVHCQIQSDTQTNNKMRRRVSKKFQEPIIKQRRQSSIKQQQSSQMLQALQNFQKNQQQQHNGISPQKVEIDIQSFDYISDESPLKMRNIMQPLKLISEQEEIGEEEILTNRYQQKQRKKKSRKIEYLDQKSPGSPIYSGNITPLSKNSFSALPSTSNQQNNQFFNSQTAFLPFSQTGLPQEDQIQKNPILYIQSVLNEIILQQQNTQALLQQQLNQHNNLIYNHSNNAGFKSKQFQQSSNGQSTGFHQTDSRKNSIVSKHLTSPHQFYTNLLQQQTQSINANNQEFNNNIPIVEGKLRTQLDSQLKVDRGERMGLCIL